MCLRKQPSVRYFRGWVLSVYLLTVREKYYQLSPRRIKKVFIRLLQRLKTKQISIRWDLQLVNGDTFGHAPLVACICGSRIQVTMSLCVLRRIRHQSADFVRQPGSELQGQRPERDTLLRVPALVCFVLLFSFISNSASSNFSVCLAIRAQHHHQQEP